VGSIWTSLAGCTKADAPLVNGYSLRDPVVLTGSNFPSDTTLFWSIQGRAGSCTPEEIISGWVITDLSGFVSSLTTTLGWATVVYTSTV